MRGNVDNIILRGIILVCYLMEIMLRSSFADSENGLLEKEGRAGKKCS